jgi:hypothetical protein
VAVEIIVRHPDDATRPVADVIVPATAVTLPQKNSFPTNSSAS